MPPEQATALLYTGGGALCMLLAAFGDRLMEKLGWQPLSDWFMTPHYRRSARWRERCARLALGLLGISLLVQHFGHLVLAPLEVMLLALLFLGGAGLLIVVMIAVTIAAGMRR